MNDKSGRIVASLGSATVGALVAKTAVVAGVQALGFTTAGIVAGSSAATAMSASAIATGGVVATGSVVSVLQSIGAVGAVAGPLGLVVGSAGAVVGLVISRRYSKRRP